MTQTYRWTAALGALAVVGAVVVIETSASGPAPTPRATAPSEPVPSAPRTATTKAFCSSFSRFAASYSNQLTSPDGVTTPSLEAAGADLTEVGRPPEMSDLEALGRDLFVADALRPFRHLFSAGPSPSDDEKATSSDDILALETFNAFLTETCKPT